MTMTIDEKYDNAIQLLHGYYDGKNDHLRIASSMLEENGFGIDFYGEFRSMTCPRLAREGILRESPFSLLPSDKGIIDQEKYKQLSRKTEMTGLSWDEYGKIVSEMSSLDRIITFVVDGKKLEAAYRKSQTQSTNQKISEIVFDGLSSDAKWSSIKIEFLNRDDVEISVNGKSYKHSNAKEMGFIKTGTKDERNDKQWDFLRYLATIYFAKNESGELLMKPTIENLIRERKETREAVMQIKSKLADQLKRIFGINDKPFKKYDPSRGYEPKFELVPEPELRRDKQWEVNTRKGYDESIEHNNHDRDDLDATIE
jgi:hypothetical protein